MTPEEQKAIDEKIAARVAELKTYAGKTFRQKGLPKSPLVRIIDYGGVKAKTLVRDGQVVKESAHTFIVEMKGARWTPGATAFLDIYEEINVPETKTETTAIPI